MYFAISIAIDSDAQFHHAARDTLFAAMRDADTRPDDDAQVIQVSGLPHVVPSREVGQAWNKI